MDNDEWIIEQGLDDAAQAIMLASSYGKDEARAIINAIIAYRPISEVAALLIESPQDMQPQIIPQ